jgi:hypothetical protein
MTRIPQYVAGKAPHVLTLPGSESAKVLAETLPTSSNSCDMEKTIWTTPTCGLDKWFEQLRLRRKRRPRSGLRSFLN